MANYKAVPNEEWDVRFGPQSVNFITDTSVIIGKANQDSDRVIATQVFVLFTNANGTLSQQAIATVDDGTTGHTIASSTTFTNPVTNRYTQMAIPALAYQVTGDAEDVYYRLLITQNAIGQATTFRERTNNIATLTTGANHNLVAGQTTQVASVGGTGYNGIVTVLDVPSATTFTYYNVGADEGSTADTDGRVGILIGQVVVNALYMGDLDPASSN